MTVYISRQFLTNLNIIICSVQMKVYFFIVAKNLEGNINILII